MAASDGVTLAAYDPAWPAAFAREPSCLANAVAPLGVTRIEHVGRTVVPGLSTKPVIDMLASAPRVRPVVAYTSVLAPAGYALVPTGMPLRHLFGGENRLRASGC